MNFKNMEVNNRVPMYCGRRPKNESIEPSDPIPNEEEQEEQEEEEEENLDEEVNFDKPTIKRDQIWNDYAEDLDYDQ